MTKTAAIIGGGSLSEDFALRFFEKNTCDYLIAADRGLLVLKKMGIVPTHIVGDFDSAREEETRVYRDMSGVEVCRLNPVKDITDTHAALDIAFGLDCKKIFLLGCTGRRLDHTIAAIRDLRFGLAENRECVILDPCNRIRLVNKRMVLRKKEQYGRYISLFAFGETVRGLTLTCFRYPLNDYDMESVSALGVSNELTAAEGIISMKSGTLVVIESKDGEL